MTGCAAPLLRRLSSRYAVALIARLPSHQDESKLVCYHDGRLDLKPTQVALCEQVVQILLASGSPIDTEDKDFGLPLHIASFIGSELLVKLILERGGGVDATGGYFETALFAAVEGRRTEIMKLLLERGAEANRCHQEFGTPLCRACGKDDIESARALLSHGADPNIETQSGETPLSLALKSNNRPLLSLLAESKVIPRVRDEDILIAARLFRHHDVLDWLLKLDENVIPSEDTIRTLLREPGVPAKSIGGLVVRNRDLGVTEKMLKLASRATVVQTLLRIRPICKLTLGVIGVQRERAAIGLLLDHDENFSITEAVVLAVLRTPSPSPPMRASKDVLGLLWERNPELRVTTAMISAASKSPSDLQFILERNVSAPVRYESLCTAASWHPDVAHKLIRMLLAHDKTLKPREETVSLVLARHPSDKMMLALGALLESNPALQIPGATSLAVFDPVRFMAWTQLQRQLDVIVRQIRIVDRRNEDV
ncbi:ankyrin repeat-containing domain protein [Cercophora newfieldiana]|uniref:Ankyrin repeat-containing domain protein n=1 Tax=Cercophora newfieldiana TaxID=92897 RepID=A0AA39YT58_9PEZI|nr:ankyrin repeat-containing domain protein [Cercophora newfieldiana]